MPKTDENGNMEFHPVELPRSYKAPEMDPDNSTIRVPERLEKSIRKCKTCGAEFELLGDYDPANPAHDLCDDCLINLPPDPNQKYPEKSTQLLVDDVVALAAGDDEP